MAGLPRFEPRSRKSQGRDAFRVRRPRHFDRLESRSLMTAGTAPTDLEQYMLELINRTRANPAAEGQRLMALAQTDPLIHQATANWNLNTFYPVISSYPPEPPRAFNPRLIDAALVETNAMLAGNTQKHSPTGFLTNPSVADDTDGLPYLPTGNTSWATGENIFAYSQGVNATSPTSYADFFEAGFLLDWGNPDFGHLKNILAHGPSGSDLSAGVAPFSEVGIGLVTNVDPTVPPTAAANVGPAIVTQEFGWRQGVAYLTGTFYLDAQNSGIYAPGEGYGNVTIRAQGTNGQGTYQTQTWSSGGYSLQLPPGTYVVTASGPLPGVQSTTITIGEDNVGWSLGFSSNQAADIPVSSDYDGIGRDEVAAYRPSNGLWSIDNPVSGFHYLQFGQPGDNPVPGHYDGPGRTEIAVYRPSNATWYILGPNGPYSAQFGISGDVPVPGDYDGTGKTDLAVYRPSTATWYIWHPDSRTLQSTQWGIPNLDQPIPAAYDGGGRTEIAVIRPGTYQWFILTSSGYRVVQFGGPGTIPVPADYDAIGRAEVAVYQPSDGGWFIRDTGRIASFGIPWTDTPAPADYDGDGRTDFADYRPTTSEWFVQGSSGWSFHDQVGQGGVNQSLKTLTSINLGVPEAWVGWVASPGATQTFGTGTTTTSSLTSTASSATITQPAPLARSKRIDFGSRMVPRLTRKPHRVELAHLGRSWVSKKA